LNPRKKEREKEKKPSQALPHEGDEKGEKVLLLEQNMREN